MIMFGDGGRGLFLDAGREEGKTVGVIASHSIDMDMIKVA